MAASSSQPVGFLPMTTCQRQLWACTSTGSTGIHPIAAMGQTLREANSEQRLVKLKCLAQMTVARPECYTSRSAPENSAICTMQTWSRRKTNRFGVAIFRHRRTDETLARHWPSHFTRAIAAGGHHTSNEACRWLETLAFVPQCDDDDRDN